MSSKATQVSRADVIWLMRELFFDHYEIFVRHNKSSYVAGRRTAFKAVVSRMCRISDKDIDRYLDWALIQVESGERIGSLEEPAVWVRKNPA